MSYKYTAKDKGELQVSLNAFQKLLISIEHGDAWQGIQVEPEEAAEVARAILEAMGYAPSPNPHFYEGEDVDRIGKAVWWLRNHRAKLDREAEQKAEDVKVADFFTAFDGLTPTFIGDHDRRRYRAAREFFTGEIADALDVEPRVLRHGDPEPDHDTRWKDTGGNVWSYGDVCHTGCQVWRFESATGSCYGRWAHLDSCFFPMTEVLP